MGNVAAAARRQRARRPPPSPFSPAAPGRVAAGSAAAAGGNNNKDNNNKGSDKGSDLPVDEAGSLASHAAQCDTSMTCDSGADCLPGCAAGCVPSTDGKKCCPSGLEKPTAIEPARSSSSAPLTSSRSPRDVDARDPRRGGLGEAVIGLLKGLGGKDNDFLGDAAIDVAS
ncbi:hypothetical protein DL768_009408 [Monosporascus sp. mg162]|nr:hypothetical protein DL768_009408 [Monosporascus sp. mg162]